MEHDGTQLPGLEQTSIDKALLVDLQRALDAQSSEFDALDRKAIALLSTAGIIATILTTLLGWLSDPSSQLGVCPLAFVPGILLFVAVVGLAIWALWVRSFWRPIAVSDEGIEEYSSLKRGDLAAQLLSQYIGAHERNHDTNWEKASKVRKASVVLFLGVLYLAIVALYAILSS